MDRVLDDNRATLFFLLLICLSAAVLAQDGQLPVLASDPDGRPLAGIELEVEGAGRSGVTGRDGRARLPLRPDTAPGDWISLAPVVGFDTPDLLFASPWDGRVRIPASGDPQASVVTIVLVEPGAASLLENPRPLAQHIAAAAEWRVDGPDAVAATATALDVVSSVYGYEPADVDGAIRSWGARASGAFDRGLAALCAADFATAAAVLSAIPSPPDDTTAQPYDVAFFLGQALATEGRHTEAIAAYRRAQRPGGPDALLLLAWARASWRNAEYAEAEGLFQRALSGEEARFGSRHPRVGAILSELGGLYRVQGQYGAAVPLLERAVSIAEDVFGPEHPMLGDRLDSLAQLYRARRRYTDAEPLLRRSLAIAEAQLGSEHSDLADRLNQLADVIQVQGRYPEAETLFLRALAISENSLGPDHPTVGIRLNNLAMVYQAMQRYGEAEALFQQALPILEAALGPTHGNVAGLLQNYGMLLREMGRTEEGAALEARAAAARGR